jgi:hypothetical protein
VYGCDCSAKNLSIAMDQQLLECGKLLQSAPWQANSTDYVQQLKSNIQVRTHWLLYLLIHVLASRFDGQLL